MRRISIITISLIVATLFTINAFWLQLHGTTTIDIINRLPILFAPANYVYYIWFPVFIFLFLWVKNYLPLRQSDQFITFVQTVLFLCTLSFQITYLLCWHSEQLIAASVLLILQLISVSALYLTYPLKKELFKLRLPISIYFSWTTFLFILYIWYILIDNGWQGFGLSNALWAVIIMTFGTAVALHLRFHHFDIAFPMVFIWCYIGIAFANGFGELLVTTAALFLSGVMVVGILFMKKNPVHLK